MYKKKGKTTRVCEDCGEKYLGGSTSKRCYDCKDKLRDKSVGIKSIVFEEEAQ